MATYKNYIEQNAVHKKGVLRDFLFEGQVFQNFILLL